MRFGTWSYFLLFLIGVVVLGLASRMLMDDHRHRENVVVARGLAATQGELLRLIELLGLERGIYNAALRDDKVGDPGSDILSAPSRAVDAAFAAALANGRASGHPAIDLQRVTGIQASIHEWRARADATVIRPPSERPAGFAEGYVAAMVEQAAALTPVFNALDAAIGQADGGVAGPMALARLAADLRSAASVRATLYVNIVASGRPIPAATHIAVAEYSGQVDAIWSRITVTLGIIDPPPALLDKVEKARDAFYVRLAGLYATIHEASDKNEPYPYTVPAFRMQQNLLTGSAGLLRSAAVEAALEAADARIRERGRRFAIVALVTAGVIALLAVLGGVFLLRIASPLSRITKTLTRIARGEHAVIDFTERRDDIGDVARALVVFQHHIEERGRRQTEREMQKFMETMIDAMPVAISVKDRNLRYRFVNRYRREIIGARDEDMVGRMLGEIVSSDMAQRVEAVDRAILETGEPQHLEQVWLGRDKNPVVIWSLKVPFRDAEGSIQGIVTCGVDITRLKEAEAELIAQRETAETANHSKTAFLANMSHELRTPLNAIIGFAEMLAAGYLGQLSNRQQDYAVSIRQSGEHLLRVVDDLLDLSRVEMGNAVLNITDCSIDQVAVAALGMVKPAAQRAGIELSYIPCGQVVRADERAMTQILVNLLGNAVKFNRSGGRVSVAVERREGAVQILVADTGVGMTAEELASAMQTLSPVNAFHARKGGGAGLGLSICRRLLDLHGGSLDIRSQRSIGTTVTVALPA